MGVSESSLGTMAVGGVAPSHKTFTLPSGVEAEVICGDIFNTSACVFTTGEDTHLKGDGLVSRKLKELCQRAYTDPKEELKKKTTDFKLGSVHPVHLSKAKGYAKSNGHLQCQAVYHAIVPNIKISKTEKEWRETMISMYYKLMRMADREGQKSIALPLLGSGGAGASPKDAADVLAEALATFRYSAKHPKRALRKVCVYTHNQTSFSAVVDRLARRPKVTEVNGGSRDGGSRYSQSSARKQASKFNAPLANGQENDDESNLAKILAGASLKDREKTNTQGAARLKEENDEEEPMDTEEHDHLLDDEEVKGEAKRKPAEEKEEEEEDRCAICLDELTCPKKLDKCGHTFCQECIDSSFRHKPACPTCNTMYGLVLGTQPSGTMRVTRDHRGLPGHRDCGMLVIDYDIPSGVQAKEHPNPGRMYHGTSRRAYLPDSAEGRVVCRLLRVAFDNRLVFTVGVSRTTGRENVVTWNDIHHKTSVEGGTTQFGYPDPHYLSRVKEELAAKGVTEACLQGRAFDV